MTLDCRAGIRWDRLGRPPHNSSLYQGWGPVAGEDGLRQRRCFCSFRRALAISADEFDLLSRAAGLFAMPKRLIISQGSGFGFLTCRKLEPGYRHVAMRGVAK